MDTQQLEAQRKQAEASLQRAIISVDTARSLQSQREAEREAAAAVIGQREAEQDAAERKLARTEQLIRTNTTSLQTLDDDRASAQRARAAVAAAKASLSASEAAIGAAKAQIIDAEASVVAAQAAIESIVADINDSTLRSPREGRVQYRVAQRRSAVVWWPRPQYRRSQRRLHDLLPADRTGGPHSDGIRGSSGSRRRPSIRHPRYGKLRGGRRTIHTQDRRDRGGAAKLMFRIRAKISPELLREHIQYVKTGLPGMAYVRIAQDAEWPAHFTEAR